MTFERLGIIPAAGKAERFGGILKECLPVGSFETLLEMIHSELNAKCSEVVLVTTPEKISDHASLMTDDVIYMVQGYDCMGMWGGILEAMRIPAERYFMAMPDTYISGIEDPDGDFVMGTFRTNTPERYGMIRGNRVKNKEAGDPGIAWGVLIWSKKVRDFWNDIEPVNYTDAINEAMYQFDWKTFELDYYYDMATFDDYKRLIRERLS